MDPEPYQGSFCNIFFRDRAIEYSASGKRNVREFFYKFFFVTDKC